MAKNGWFLCALLTFYTSVGFADVLSTSACTASYSSLTPSIPKEVISARFSMTQGDWDRKVYRAYLNIKAPQSTMLTTFALKLKQVAPTIEMFNAEKTNLSLSEFTISISKKSEKPSYALSFEAFKKGGMQETLPPREAIFISQESSEAQQKWVSEFTDTRSSIHGSASEAGISLETLLLVHKVQLWKNTENPTEDLELIEAFDGRDNILFRLLKTTDEQGNRYLVACT